MKHLELPITHVSNTYGTLINTYKTLTGIMTYKALIKH